MRTPFLRSSALLAVGLSAGCCCCPPPKPAPEPATRPAPVATLAPLPVAPQAVVPPSAVVVPTGPGPTEMARVANGYELRNRDVRVVIDPATGDVVTWGTPAQPRNTVAGPRGIHATLANLPDVPPAGYVEKRDDQTWQFYGSDANRVTWRKVYNLDHDSLLVSFVIQNDRPTPLPAAVRVVGDLTDLRIAAHDPEQFTGTGGYGTVSLHGWNIAHGQPPPALPVLLQSDMFTLQPGERQGYTTEWRLSPLGGP